MLLSKWWIDAASPGIAFFVFNSYADPVVSNPPAAVYKIGTNFCLEFGSTSPARTRGTLDCDIIQRNLSANIPGAFPQPERTWEKDGVTYYSATPWADPVITPEFMTTNPLLQGLMSNALTAQTSGSLVFKSHFTLWNNSLVMFPPGTTSASAKRMIFESLLGTWTCSVNNSLGNESCSSTIRECGRYLHVGVPLT